MVAVGAWSAPSVKHSHLLVDVEVDQTGGAVVKHGADHLKGVDLQGVAFVETPAEHQVFSFKAIDGSVFGRGERSQFSEFGLFDIFTGLPFAKVFVDDGNHLVRIEIASHADGHVVRAIPLVEVILDVGDAGILQMLLGSNGGLCAVRMGGEEQGV